MRSCRQLRHGRLSTAHYPQLLLASLLLTHPRDRHPYIRPCFTHLGRRALESYEEVLGEKHPDTLGSVNNLAMLLKAKGDYDGAEPLFRWVQDHCKHKYLISLLS